MVIRCIRVFMGRVSVEKEASMVREDEGEKSKRKAEEIGKE